MEATKQIVYLESMISSIVSCSPYSPLLRELRAFASCLRRRRCLVISILLLVSSTYSKNIADRYCYTAARKTKFKREREQEKILAENKQASKKPLFSGLREKEPQRSNKSSHTESPQDVFSLIGWFFKNLDSSNKTADAVMHARLSSTSNNIHNSQLCSTN